MISSNALRSVTRSLITGNALARHGSMSIVSPSAKCRMCSWQVVVFFCGPCAVPLMTMAHEPQMPSRQSWSNETGSWSSSTSFSLSTSSISRNDMSGSTSSSTYFFILPLASAEA